MFNIQLLLTMASQAMMKKLISSDEMYQQWCNFSAKMGLPKTSRAEFDSLVSQFNNTDSNSKLSQLGSNPDAIAKMFGNFMK